MDAPDGKENCTKTVAFEPTSFILHTFAAEIADRQVLYQVIKMAESVLICINYKNGLHLSDLSLSMLNPYENIPMGTQLVGDFLEGVSKTLAVKLCKKLNKHVYVSCNVDNDKMIMPLVEKRLHEEICKFPEKF